MSLDFRSTRTLFRTELRMVLRDRRMLFVSIILPMLVTPLMFIGSSWGIKRHERKLDRMVYAYAISGKDTAWLRSVVTATRERLEASARTNETALKLKEITSPDPRAALDNDEIQFLLETSRAAEQPSLKVANADQQNQSRRPSTSDADPDAQEQPASGAPIIRILFYGNRHESASGMARIEQAFLDTRRIERAQLLESRGFPVAPGKLAQIKRKDVASKSQVAGLALGRFLTMLLVLFILSGGAVVATDSLAGEKERGTLETLLTTAAGRLEILAAKHLVIVTVALVITSLQMVNLLVYIRLRLIPVPVGFAAALTPATALLLLILYLPLIALAANSLLLVSGYARTYKQAQMWFLPLVFVGVLPALAPMLPGVPLRSIAVLVPVANIAVAAKEILIGSFDWPMIFVAWLTTAAAAAGLGRIGIRSLVQEKLITASERDEVEFAGGLRLFERRVWLVSNYTQELDLRLQLLINLVGLFFIACVLMIRVYHLDWRAAMAFRLPRPGVWLGVLAGVPGAFVTAIACYQFGNLLIPAPTQVTETFTKAVLPPQIPFLELVLFLSILPGFFEEITFRGLLLHGLRRRLNPLLLTIVVGMVFGIFHVALFRFVPTAFLGALFAAATLLTGSIFPAMIWHACSNALGVLASQWQFPENNLDFTCYATGLGLLLVSFWILWRHRTPYPGIKSSRAGRFTAH
jgi:sodium transport system permease protein